MNNSAQYHQSARIGLFGHFHGQGLLVRDSSKDIVIDAKVRSGDYLEAVATELDKLAAYLATDDLPEAIDLERLAGELLYVHAHYNLKRK